MRNITLEEPISLAAPVLTVGTFDGIHVGHMSVIRALIDQARECGGTSVVVTFDPHPRQFIDKEHAPGLLTTLAEKQSCLASLGVDILAVVRFDDVVRSLTPEAFVETYLVKKLGAKVVIVGYDHGFGKDRQGGFETMATLGKHYGFAALSLPPTLVDGQPVSSTRIRQALAGGDLDAVVRYLGRGYPVWGRVVKGDGRGHQIGFPTANLRLETPGKLLPPPGVYAGIVQHEKSHFAVINYGNRPTFNGQGDQFEVHILDFDPATNLYGTVLALELHHRIRSECVFEDAEHLIRQIEKDIETTRSLFSQNRTLSRR